MNRLIAISCLLIAVLTGCATPPPAGDLILTREDMRLKRTPYHQSEIPCGDYSSHGIAVTYSK